MPVDSLPLEAFTQTPYVGRRRASGPAALEVPQAQSAQPAGDVLLDTTLDAAVRAPLDLRLDAAAVDQVLRGLEPVDHTTSFAHEPTAQLPMVRFEPPVLPATQASGKRRAAKRAVVRTRRGLPSGPVLAGVAALAVAVSGAVLVDDDAPTSTPHVQLAAASALSGTSGQGRVGRRDAPITRDADRTSAAGVNGIIQQRNASLKQLTAQGDAQAKVNALNLWIYPLEPVILTARFGQYGLWSNFHTGLDFNGETGDQIHAIADGEVTFTGYDGSYGNKTIVTLSDGTELWYCHQSAFEVSVGDTVKQGEVIGLVGATGNVTGSHLHVEVRPGGGDPVDPYPAMQQHGLFLGSEAQPG